MTRKEIKAILLEYGLSNAFSIREADFSDLARDSVKCVQIKNWRPNPVATEIKDCIWNRFHAVTEFI